MDGRLIALDAKTGKVVWDHEAVRPEEGESETASGLTASSAASRCRVRAGSASRCRRWSPTGSSSSASRGAGYGLHVEDEKGGLDGGSVVGIEGGYGRRGWLAAYDAKTGEERWRWYVTKADGWEGGFVETTADGVPLHRDIAAEKAAAPANRDAWRVGGGSLWMTPAYDPELGLIYPRHRQPGAAEFRPLAAGRQPLHDEPRRPRREDRSAALVLPAGAARRVGLRRRRARPSCSTCRPDGAVKAVASASKTGWIYVHDRATGRLIERSAPLIAQKNLFAPPTAEGTVVAARARSAPSPGRPPPTMRQAASPTRRSATGRRPTRSRPCRPPPAGRRSATPRPARPRASRASAPSRPSTSRDGGSIAWSVASASRLVGGTLATAGGLVFSGEEDGHLDAHDARTGGSSGASSAGPASAGRRSPTRWTGKQYVAVAAGGASFTKASGFGTGDALVVFALPD